MPCSCCRGSTGAADWRLGSFITASTGGRDCCATSGCCFGASGDPNWYSCGLCGLVTSGICGPAGGYCVGRSGGCCAHWLGTRLLACLLLMLQGTGSNYLVKFFWTSGIGLHCFLRWSDSLSLLFVLLLPACLYSIACKRVSLHASWCKGSLSLSIKYLIHG